MELAVQERNILGKKVRSLRKNGVLPAELYGRGAPNVHLAVPEREFVKMLREAGENTIFDLAVGKEKYPAMVHGISRDPIKGDIVHIDFYRIRLDEKVRVHVPLEFTGEAPAEKEKGGIVNKSMSEIEVEALPMKIPHAIKVSLASLDDLDKSIYVKDLAVPEGVEILVDPETVVATVTEPVKEEEAPAEPIDVSSVKVETEEKKEARQKEAGEEGAGD